MDHACINIDKISEIVRRVDSLENCQDRMKKFSIKHSEELVRLNGRIDSEHRSYEMLLAIIKEVKDDVKIIATELQNINKTERDEYRHIKMYVITTIIGVIIGGAGIGFLN